MTREPLPSRRPAESFDFEHRQIEYTATMGYYPDGRLGECFIKSRKDGSHLDDAARDLSVLFSMFIQHGGPINKLRAAVTRDPDGSPASVIGKLLDLLAAEDSARQVA